MTKAGHRVLPFYSAGTCGVLVWRRTGIERSFPACRFHMQHAVGLAFVVSALYSAGECGLVICRLTGIEPSHPACRFHMHHAVVIALVVSGLHSAGTFGVLICRLIGFARSHQACRFHMEHGESGFPIWPHKCNARWLGWSFKGFRLRARSCSPSAVAACCPNFPPWLPIFLLRSWISSLPRCAWGKLCRRSAVASGRSARAET